jgi:hypothetical protein
MTKIALNLRGIDQRGEFTIQTRVEATDLLAALNLVMERWALDGDRLTKVHVEFDKVPA